MEQRRGVDELDRGGELVMAGAGVAEQVGASEREHRPHPLAAAGDQMAGQFGDQRDLALHALENHRVDAVHVSRDQPDHRIERRCAAGRNRVDRRGHGPPLAGRRWFS